MNAPGRAHATTSRHRRRRFLIISAGIAGLLIAAVTAYSSGVLAVGTGSDAPPAQARDSVRAEATSTAGKALPTVEVPDVTASSLEEARIVLSSAGLEAQAIGDSPNSAEVVAQEPAAGTLVPAGSAVRLVAESPESASPMKGSEWVVCIDPGHQRRSDMTPEPIGPGTKQTKPSVTGGTSGVTSGMAEYEVVLQISTNLKRRLEEAGVNVVMTRNTNDVNLPNSERAAIANQAGADLFVRVHCDGSPDSEMSGVSTLFPANAKWTKPIWKESRRAAESIQAATVTETGALDRGILSREDLAGFNYSKVPAILIECGFMSHPIEDKLLASPHYQDKLAKGLAQGIRAYLESADE